MRFIHTANILIEYLALYIMPEEISSRVVFGDLRDQGIYLSCPVNQVRKITCRMPLTVRPQGGSMSPS
jgi:hypothetical protein